MALLEGKSNIIAIWAGVVGLFTLVGIGIGFLLMNIQAHKDEALMFPQQIVRIGEKELNPEIWGRNFPRQFDSFMKSQIDYGSTPYGGGTPYSKLDRYPASRELWAGYPFSVEYNKARGHYYALIDQKNTRRIKEFKQPGACANCHAAEAPGLAQEMGWEAFNQTPYNNLKDRLHTGSSCADCHEPQTMTLRITRPAFKNAMETMGIDLAKATRQDMRTYVCAQCHVEYYFKGDNKILTFPWKNGLGVDQIEAYYDAVGWSDFQHAVTKTPILKMQHPDFELYSSGIHAKSGVACADCHMPYTREGGIKVSDHWVRSPLNNLNNACQTCHKIPEEQLKARVALIQDRTAELLRKTEVAISDAIDAITSAQQSGANDESLTSARNFHRRAQMRWDFVFSENSTGFHSGQEAARILANALDFARQAQLAAFRANPKPLITASKQ